MLRRAGVHIPTVLIDADILFLKYFPLFDIAVVVVVVVAVVVVVVLKMQPPLMRWFRFTWNSHWMCGKLRFRIVVLCVSFPLGNLGLCMLRHTVHK